MRKLTALVLDILNLVFLKHACSFLAGIYLEMHNMPFPTGINQNYSISFLHVYSIYVCYVFTYLLMEVIKSP